MTLGGVLLLVTHLVGCAGPELGPWHTVKLEDEFVADQALMSFDEYRSLEDRLITQLLELSQSNAETFCLEPDSRFCADKGLESGDAQENWNRTLEFAVPAPRGGVLLLHGMSDSPYSLSHFAPALVDDGFHVLALRYPGHGTLPSGLRNLEARDLSAAVRIAARHLTEKTQGQPLHIIGYSTGATLAIEYALDAAESEEMQVPASLVLISPAIRVHRAAAFARFKNTLAMLPGAQGMAWLDVMPENDPYKYNSFATNAAAVVNELTRRTDRRVRSLPEARRSAIPPILAIKSTVDATVNTDAVVDNLLIPIDSAASELILFDINHVAATEGKIAIDQDRFTQRLLASDILNFRLTLVTNTEPTSRSVKAISRGARSREFESSRVLSGSWPVNTLSLSHIALPFPPEDPFYGSTAADDRGLTASEPSLRGERGVSALPSDAVLRMRYNPFFEYTLQRTRDWLTAAEDREVD